MSEHGQRLFIARAELGRAHLGPDPDAPARRLLAPGQVRLAVEAFSLTANNITYAAFGEAMKYWQFFPAGDAALGCLPVWGFATVAESRAEGVVAGRRVWGYYPDELEPALREALALDRTVVIDCRATRRSTASR